MKDIGFMMEQIPKKALRNFLLAYLAEVIILAILVVMQIQTAMIYDIALMIGIAMIYGVHRLRLTMTIDSGALNRILLLPVKRRTFMLSELLFTLATILLYFLILYGVWFGVNHLLYPDASMGYLVQMSLQFDCYEFLIPQTNLHLFMILYYILMISVQCVALCLGISFKEKIGMGGSLALSSMMLFNGFSGGTFSIIFMMLLMSLLIGMCLYDINKCIGFKRKKVQS